MFRAYGFVKGWPTQNSILTDVTTQNPTWDGIKLYLKPGLWSRSRLLGFETVSRRTNVSSRSRLFASRAQDVILPKLVWIKGTEYCTDFLSLSEQGVYAWSRLHVIVLYTLILCIIIVIINGRENKVTTAVIITCRPTPILTSRWRLVTYKRLVSVSSRSRALT